MKAPRTICFVKGSVPSKEAFSIAKSLGNNVVFRNANYVSNDDSLENCDGVCGEVPESYKNKPDAFEVYKDWQKSASVDAEVKQMAFKEVEEVKKDAKPASKNGHWGPK